MFLERVMTAYKFQVSYLMKTLATIPLTPCLATMATWEDAQDQQTSVTTPPAPTHLSIAEVCHLLKIIFSRISAPKHTTKTQHLTEKQNKFLKCVPSDITNTVSSCSAVSLIIHFQIQCLVYTGTLRVLGTQTTLLPSDSVYEQFTQ